MKSILYLGIDPPVGVFHYPVIRTQKIESSDLQKALKLPYSYIIFTSKNSVRYWPLSLLGKKAIVIGEATAELAKKRGAECLLAKNPTQEGVIEKLNTLDLQKAFLLYPHSKLARPNLSQYLKNFPHFSFALYDTIYQKPEPIPDLTYFHEIVFTSPSTVYAFKCIFAKIPKSITLTAIGPITKRVLTLEM